MSRSASAFNTDFNPRTPVGCDRDGAIGLAVTDISIHAPQWGATVYLIKNQVTKGISIHAPQWGATRHARATGERLAYFNPRTPVGCDVADSGADAGVGNFNPRTPVGCDPPPSLFFPDDV